MKLGNEWCFLCFDANGDNGLDKAEFTKLVKCCCKMFEVEKSDDEIADKFAAADTDHDGQLSLDEFLAHCESMKEESMKMFMDLVAKCKQDPEFKKMCMGQTPIDCHIPMLNCCFKKCKKICERMPDMDMKSDDPKVCMANMKKMVNDDEALCCMSCIKMCLFDKNGDK